MELWKYAVWVNNFVLYLPSNKETIPIPISTYNLQPTYIRKFHNSCTYLHQYIRISV